MKLRRRTGKNRFMTGCQVICTITKPVEEEKRWKYWSSLKRSESFLWSYWMTRRMQRVWGRRYAAADCPAQK